MTSRTRTWRVLLCAIPLMTMTLCSASDPELDAKLEAVQQSLDDQRIDEAVTAARDLAADSADPRVQARLGTALMRQARREEKVLDEDRVAAAGMANDPAAYFDPSLFRVEVSYDDELRQESEEAFGKALQGDDSLLEAYLGLATIYNESGRYEEEVALIARAAPAVKDVPDAAGMLVHFGELHLQARRYAAALGVLAPLQGTFPSEPAVALDYAAAKFASGSFAAGVAAVETALAANPTHVNMQQVLGQMRMYRLQWQQAADTFAKLVAQGIDDPRTALLHQGGSLMPIDMEAAQAILEQAAGDRRDQITAISRNLIVVMTSSEVTNDDIVRMVGQLNQNGFPQLGAALCGLLLSRDAQNVQAHVMLAYVYDTQRYNDPALAQLDEAAAIMKATPGKAGSFTTTELEMHYGRVHFNNKDYETAIDYLSRAGDPGSYGFILGLSYEGLGKYEEAYNALKRLVDKGTPEQLARRARHQLEKDVYATFR